MDDRERRHLQALHEQQLERFEQQAKALEALRQAIEALRISHDALAQQLKEPR